MNEKQAIIAKMLELQHLFENLNFQVKCNDDNEFLIVV